MKNRIITIFIFSILLIASSSYAKDIFYEVKAKKFSYTPNIIKVDKGDVVRIRLISEDVRHGMFIDGYNIKTTAYPGQEGSLSFVADKTGRFSFRCSVTCGEFHPYMTGFLVVEPNTRFFMYALITLGIGLGSIVLTFFVRKDEGVNG